LIFQHVPHPHVSARRKQGPVTTSGQLPRGSAFSRFNSRLGLRITTAVGTMVCAYAFTLWALYGLPNAIKSGPSGLVLWGSSEFAQLVLLPIIIVGQNLQAKASDKRAEQTFLDAEAVLHEAAQIQAHLAAQDAEISRILGYIGEPDTGRNT
jgi:hypothetical protein